MIAGKLLKRMVLLIGLACVVISAAPQFDATALQPDLGYDLLFLATPPVRHHSPPPYPVHLFHLNTATGDVTLLDITDRPVSLNALSPDGQYLAVIRGERLCLVDRAWETRFCLPSGMVDPANFEASFIYNKVYWATDSNSFWIPSRAVDQPVPSMVQISVDDGSILSTETAPIDRAVIDFSPVSKNAVFRDGDVYNIETHQRLFLGNWGHLSPDGQRYAVTIWYDEDEAGREVLLIAELGDEYRGYPWDPAWATLVMGENVWGENDLELKWNSGLSWSNDGQYVGSRWIYRSWIPSDDGYRTNEMGTYVYNTETQELRLIGVDDAWNAHQVWAPDDTAIAQALGDSNGSIEGLSIVTLEGEVYPISIESFFPLEEDPLVVPKFYAITWLPRGWLDVDAFAMQTDRIDSVD